MKKVFKITAFLTSMVLLLALTGCDLITKVVRENAPQYKETVQGSEPQELIAENDKFSMKWDNVNRCIALTDISSGKVWSTAIPADKLSGSAASQPILKSDIVIDYVAQYDVNYKSVYSADTTACIRSFETVENGIRIVYSFHVAEISVPVNYTLCDDGMRATIDVNEIAEGDTFMLYRVSLAPSLLNTPNKSENSYFLIPSGQGTLCYPADGTVRYSSSMVYGRDLAVSASTSHSETERTYMPIYGMKDGTDAMFAVIEDGEESASIEQNINDSKLGNSFSYSVFYVRGYEEANKKAFSSSSIKSYIYNDELADTEFSLKFYPLSGDKADYSGMAEVYRKFLDEKYGETDNDIKSSPSYALQFLGGVDYNQFIFGIPYTAQYALTTLEDAEGILEELAEKTGVNPVVQLTGFTKDGLENKRLAGGFKISSKLGSMSDLAELQKEYAKDGGTLVMDFDIIHFSQSSNGFSKLDDIAKTANGEKAIQYRYHMALRVEDKSHKNYNILARDRITDAVEKLLEKSLKYKLTGVGLSTLGNTIYSDNNAREYFSRSNMADEFINAAEKFRKEGITVITNSANEYAAATADYVLDAPVQSAKQDLMDEDIPFYQMVYGSRTPLYVRGINLASEGKIAVLKAVESGSGLGFTLTKNYSTELLSTTQSVLFGTKFDGLKEDMVEYINSYNSLYEKIIGCEITEHKILENGVRATYFNNGICVYTNYGEKEAIVGEIRIAPFGFEYEEVRQ